MGRVRNLLRFGFVPVAAAVVVVLAHPLPGTGPAPASHHDDARSGESDRFHRVLRSAARQTAAHEEARNRADGLRRRLARLRAQAAGEDTARARAAVDRAATGPHLHFEVRVTPYPGSSVPSLPWLRRHGVRL
jgi:hypothetical protein